VQRTARVALYCTWRPSDMTTLLHRQGIMHRINLSICNFEFFVELKLVLDYLEGQNFLCKINIACPLSGSVF